MTASAQPSPSAHLIRSDAEAISVAQALAQRFTGDQARIDGEQLYCTGALFAHIVPTVAVDEHNQAHIAFIERDNPGPPGLRPTHRRRLDFADHPGPRQPQRRQRRPRLAGGGPGQGAVGRERLARRQQAVRTGRQPLGVGQVQPRPPLAQRSQPGFSRNAPAPDYATLVGAGLPAKRPARPAPDLPAPSSASRLLPRRRRPACRGWLASEQTSNHCPDCSRAGPRHCCRSLPRLWGAPEVHLAAAPGHGSTYNCGLGRRIQTEHRMTPTEPILLWYGWMNLPWAWRLSSSRSFFRSLPSLIARRE